MLTPTSRGEFIITLSQNGKDVVANGAGSFNLTALSGPGAGFALPGVEANIADVLIGAAGTVDTYNGFTGPTSFGPGATLNSPTSESGQTVGLIGGDNILFVPHAYHSGDQMSSSATWSNTTISNLGLTSGTYTWRWGTEANADDLVVQIGPTAVSAPGGLALAGMGGVTLLAGAAWRRQRGKWLFA
jgi:hypothetical protein